MNELVLNTKTLPEPLFRMVRTEKFKVSESNGIINLTPILEVKSGCPLRGIASASDLTVDKFLAMKRNDKELEQ